MIFGEALDRPAGEDRAAYLREACGKDQALRARVESLLKLHGEAGLFLDGHDGAAAGAESGASGHPGLVEGAGTVIGRYKLLQVIGEGGFGVVYMAEQKEPVKRRVALKIIKLGMDTRQVVARFEAERQALAMMDHPNIAKVLDGGATITGRPYFVMELVRGVPLMEFCDEQHLTLPERLSLFVQICGAIQHAHQKGVIHRDIKPSNVLVSMHDDQIVPKVIDFGIAKATQQDLTDKTLFTAYHEVMGTPAYMSPEQAHQSGLDIDTRSDIYSLGVLLYELLTGRTPFDGADLMSGGYEEMRRRIREEEPLKPSTRFKTLALDDRTIVARRRRSDPVHLGSFLKGDLDWIVMKALEKSRARRYESACALAHDIQCYLRNEPVSAAAPTMAYKFRKFARRHRAILTTAILFCVLLVSGAVTSTYFAIRAKRAEVVARRQAAVAEGVNRFVNEDFFAQVDPEVEPDRQLTLRTALDRAVRQMGDRFRDQPLVEAEILTTVGQAYRNLGQYDEAEPRFHRAYELRFHELGEEHPDTLLALSDYAMVKSARQEREEALSMAERVLELGRARLGDTHPLTFKFKGRLAWICFVGQDTTNAHTLAVEAEADMQKIPELEAGDRARVLQVLGRTLGRKGRIEEGEQHVRTAHQLLESVYGPNHPRTLYARNFLAAYLYDHRLNLDEAEQLYRSTLEHWQRIYGEAHHYPWIAQRNLSLLYMAQNRFPLAARELLLLLDTFPPEKQKGDLDRLDYILSQTSPEALSSPVALVPGAWRMSPAAPSSSWASPQFQDQSWPLLENPPPSEVWLRQTFTLDQPLSQRPILIIRNNGDFDVYLNGTPVRRSPWGRSERFQVLVCDKEITDKLEVGRNVLAIHGRNLQNGAPLDIQVISLPPPHPRATQPDTATAQHHH